MKEGDRRSDNLRPLSIVNEILHGVDFGESPGFSSKPETMELQSGAEDC